MSYTIVYWSSSYDRTTRSFLDITLRFLCQLPNYSTNSDSELSLQYHLSSSTMFMIYMILTSDLAEQQLDTLLLADEEYKRIEKYLSSQKNKIPVFNPFSP